MLQRCENKNNPNYPYYGGRGIYVCDEWHDFSTFREDMLALGFNHDKPAKDQTMDRIDNDGPYAPWNIRIVGMDVQHSNRRDFVNPGPRKSIEALDDDGNVIKTFDSVTSASNWCGRLYTSSCISAALRGRTKHAYGYRWRYVSAES